MKGVKYNLDPSVLLEIPEKLKSDEEYGCSNLVDRPVSTVYPELFLRSCRQNKTTHTPHNTTKQTNDSRTAGSVGWLWLKCEFACRRNGVSFGNPLFCFSIAAQFWSNPDNHSKHLKVIVGSFLGSFGDLGGHIGFLGGHLGTVWDPYSNVKAFGSDSGKNGIPILGAFLGPFFTWWSVLVSFVKCNFAVILRTCCGIPQWSQHVTFKAVVSWPKCV